MIISQYETIPFSIPFVKPLQTVNEIYNFREGLWIKLYSDNLIGIGEIAPLKGFSSENLKDANYNIEGFINAIENENYDQEDLISLIEVHTKDTPSIRFGLETAIFDLLSKKANKRLSEFLNPNYKSNILINGIEGLHLPDDNFNVIKVKSGYRNLFDEIEHLEYLTQSFGNNVCFRIDMNGALDLPKSIRFCKEMERFNISYIEQPLDANNFEDLAELRYHTSIPIAVDESLTDCKSAEKLIEMQAADVFVIKPMISGGFIECSKIIELAKIENIETVITSSLETSVGTMACLHLAAANEISTACGLSTLQFLSEKNEILIKNGVMSIPDLLGLGVELNK